MAKKANITSPILSGRWALASSVGIGLALVGFVSDAKVYWLFLTDGHHGRAMVLAAAAISVIGRLGLALPQGAAPLRNIKMPRHAFAVVGAALASCLAWVEVTSLVGRWLDSQLSPLEDSYAANFELFVLTFTFAILLLAPDPIVRRISKCVLPIALMGVVAWFVSGGMTASGLRQETLWRRGQVVGCVWDCATWAVQNELEHIPIVVHGQPCRAENDLGYALDG